MDFVANNVWRSVTSTVLPFRVFVEALYQRKGFYGELGTRDTSKES